jgi:hypothetical protein
MENKVLYGAVLVFSGCGRPASGLHYQGHENKELAPGHRARKIKKYTKADASFLDIGPKGQWTYK